MKPTKLNFSQGDLFESRLSELLNPDHELYRLSLIIDWITLEQELSCHFNSAKGAPAKPIRLISGLFMLQHYYGLSDEATVQNWIENPYWQFFCGYDFMQWKFPIDPSSLSRWRSRLGEKGLKAILNATIRSAISIGIVNKNSFKRVIVDTTVMEKNIAYPTDCRLYLRSLEVMVRFAQENGIRLRQTYRRLGKRLARLFSRYSHARQMNRARRELKRLKTITGRVFRELERWSNQFKEQKEKVYALLEKVRKVLSQKREDKNKIYSLHEPDVECISKGKAHQKYEFGCKASLVITHKEGLALLCEAHHGNPYDGHTLIEVLKNAESQTRVPIEMAFVDKGYRGHVVERTKVFISGARKGLTNWFKKQLRRRQAIEPRFGHMKSDGKMGRNFLKGKLGDKLNAMLCGIGENVRILLNGLLKPQFN
jgi:transposase, IS5 family